MKKLKRIIKKVLIEMDLRPNKIVTLPTGVICEHFNNGNIKVK